MIQYWLLAFWNVWGNYVVWHAQVCMKGHQFNSRPICSRRCEKHWVHLPTTYVTDIDSNCFVLHAFMSLLESRRIISTYDLSCTRPLQIPHITEFPVQHENTEFDQTYIVCNASFILNCNAVALRYINYFLQQLNATYCTSSSLCCSATLQ